VTKALPRFGIHGAPVLRGAVDYRWGTCVPRIVEVDHRLALDLPRESWELAPNRLECRRGRSAAFVIKDGDVRWQPAIDVNRVI